MFNWVAIVDKKDFFDICSFYPEKAVSGKTVDFFRRMCYNDLIGIMRMAWLMKGEAKWAFLEIF